MSDKLDLEPIKQRLTAATPGPWLKGEWSGRCHIKHNHGMPHDPCKYDYTIRQGENNISIILPNQEPRYLLNNYGDWGRLLSEENIDLIANAPTDIAALIAEVERLRKEIADYKADDALWWNNHHE